MSMVCKMKRKIFLFLFICFYVNKLFCFSFYTKYEIDPGKEIELKTDGTAIISDYEGNAICKTRFTVNQYSKLCFISFLDEGVKYDNDPVKKVLLLGGKEIKSDSERNLARGYYNTSSWFIVDVPRSMEGYDSYKDCTSYLKEGEKEYSIDNLSEIRSDSPWVEGVEGYGEGEGFTIVGNKPYLLIVNGFISVQKPYLYEQNSRVKELKITGSKSKKSKILELIDTPNFQTVDISFLEKDDDTIVQIHSVYAGTKYIDTCISLCKLHNLPVIPYMGDK